MRLTHDTIYAPATPVTTSAVMVFRLSGPRALDGLATLTTKTTKAPPPRQAQLMRLYHPKTQQILDRALVLYFPAPNSFTGEDVIELHCHGSVALHDILCEIWAQMDGLRMADPGEFIKRAFLHGKMDLTQIEGVADLIEAKTSRQLEQAALQAEGALKKLIESWRHQLIDILAKAEGFIDFADEDDLGEELLDTLEDVVRTLRSQIAAHLDDAHRGEQIRSGCTIVLVGAPNAGKSSLINALARRDVAIVSDQAGTTRDAIEVALNIDGLPVTLVDTAGLRNTNHAIEQAGIARTHDHAKRANLICVLIDATQPESRHAILKHAASYDAPCLFYWSKSDLANPPAIEGFSPLSVITPNGMEPLLLDLKTHTRTLLGAQHEYSAPITQARHRDALHHVIHHLEDYLEISHELHRFELAAHHLHQAAHHLGRITGTIDVEEILDALFAQFCLGK